MHISEIQIIPIKPINGLVAFANCVIDEWLYLGSIGIYTRIGGGYRLTYPTKNVGSKSFSLFHPTDKQSGMLLEQTILNRYEEVMRKSNDRYTSSTPRLPQL